MHSKTQNDYPYFEYQCQSVIFRCWAKINSSSDICAHSLDTGTLFHLNNKAFSLK